MARVAVDHSHVDGNNAVTGHRFPLQFNATTAWSDCRNAWVLHVANWNDVFFVHESNETRVVSHVVEPLICEKRAALEKFWLHNTKLVVIKRGEALNPRLPVVYLRFEYHSVQEPERRVSL